MKVLIVGLIFLAAFGANAQSSQFTYKEKACFNALEDIDLNSFEASAKKKEVYFLNGSPRFFAQHLPIGISTADAQKLSREHIGGAVEIKDGEDMNVCFRKLDDDCVQNATCLRTYSATDCLQTFTVSFSDQNRQLVFDMIATGIRELVYIKGAYIPKYKPLSAAMKTCSGVSEQLTSALELMESKHPYRPVEGVTYPDSVLQ